ncbi:BglG family transcription antiterminator [Paenibacillus sp. N1-5-1-14]|uniref:BglG family transcription antiterminator n=1 Tax=Paenibacillus radicibacter TaxID=2972488 RepID=UPI0021596AD6|nr:BglG family transcription antiterminator [Paenibacillus radicibacter]MCR8642790.1 BglG family transcription antiterminator [Paenibacillus radicibacter]
MKGLNIPSRQRGILFLLLHRDHMTVAQIAQEIGISSRTVHRELKEIEEIIEPYQLKLLKKTSVGLGLVGDPAHKDELAHALLFTSVQVYTVPERKSFLASTLLESSEPVKLFSLSNPLKVTPATVTSDLDHLEPWLKTYQLSLIRRRGYGIELKGTETDKRKAMLALIYEHFTEAELFMLIREPSTSVEEVGQLSASAAKLLDLIAQEKLPEIVRLLNEMDSQWLEPFADTSFVHIVIYLALVMKRIEQAGVLKLEPKQIQEEMGIQELETARIIFEQLRSLLPSIPSESELYMLALYIKGARPRVTDHARIDADHIELSTVAYEIISYCEKRMHIELTADRILMQGFIAHLIPAIHRVKQRIPTINPYMDQIRQDYNELFTLMQEAVTHVLPNIPMPEGEIGYLAIHVAASLERRDTIREKFRALVFCSSGIGTSKMLASRIRNKIQEFETIENVSIFDLDKISRSSYDLVISTVKLPLPASEYVLVSPLLTQGEVDKIRTLLQARATQLMKPDSMELEQQEPLAPGPESTLKSSATLNLEQVKIYMDESIELIRGFEVFTLQDAKLSMDERMNTICRQMEQHHVIEQGQHRDVARQLLEREKLGGLGIPGSELALFHCRHQAVIKPSFTIHILETPQHLLSMENRTIPITRIMLLLSPVDVQSEQLELLSYLSSLFVERDNIEVFNTREAEAMRKLLSERLHHFCHTKF